MKNVIFCYLLILGFQMMKAQSFQETQKHIFESEVKENGVTDKSSLQSWGGTTENEIVFDIHNLEIFEDISVTVSEYSNLEYSEAYRVKLDILLKDRNNRYVYNHLHKSILNLNYPANKIHLNKRAIKTEI